MTETVLQPLVRLGQRLHESRAELTDRWIAAVLVDQEIEHSDQLTHSQLVDHLPAIYDELCRLLVEQNIESSEPAIRKDAQTHGYYRWTQGYRLDELFRELDILRRILGGFFRRFARENSDFVGVAETRAHYLMEELFSILTMNSIRQLVSEQELEIDTYTQRVEKANRELTHQQTLLNNLAASRLQITRSVAHDLRNFLHVFSTALQILQRDPARIGAAVELAQRQTEDMKVLVDQLVEYAVVLSDGGTPAVERFELADLYQELVDSYRPIAETKGLRFVSSLTAQCGVIESDRVRIKQIAFNLLSNAIKYTRQGKIALDIEVAGASHWLLRVTDTGPGIPAEDQERVFAEFERGTEKDIPGIGLGLAIVKELVLALHGEIKCRSETGKGSVFEVRFPRGGAR